MNAPSHSDPLNHPPITSRSALILGLAVFTEIEDRVRSVPRESSGRFAISTVIVLVSLSNLLSLPRSSEPVLYDDEPEVDPHQTTSAIIHDLVHDPGKSVASASSVSTNGKSPHLLPTPLRVASPQIAWLSVALIPL